MFTGAMLGTSPAHCDAEGEELQSRQTPGQLDPQLPEKNRLEEVLHCFPGFLVGGGILGGAP